MIEFKGYITGKAKKFWFYKSASYIQHIMFLPALAVFIFVFRFSIKQSNLSSVIISVIGFIVIMLMPLFKTRKGKRKITPNRIYIKDNRIYSICEENTDCKDIELVKNVYDYGDFYFLSFYLGNICAQFICQKNLLSKGTLEEFEAVFDGKILRKGRTEND